MCLETVDKETKVITEGYKVLSTYGRKYHPECQGDICKSMPTGEWLDEKDYRSPGSRRLIHITSYRSHYKCGFHIFVDRIGAINWWRSNSHARVVKVAVDKCHTSGTQDSAQVVVASKIKILRRCHVPKQS